MYCSLRTCEFFGCVSLWTSFPPSCWIPSSLLNCFLCNASKNDFLVWRGISHVLVCHLAFFFFLITDIKRWIFGVDLLNSETVSDEVFGSQTEMQVFCSELREDRSLPRSRTKTHLVVIISANKDPEGVSCNPSGLRFSQVGFSLHCEADLTRPCVIYNLPLYSF